MTSQETRWEAFDGYQGIWVVQVDEALSGAIRGLGSRSSPAGLETGAMSPFLPIVFV